MKSDRYKNYLHDLGVLTKECARDAIAGYASSKDESEKCFNAGYMMGFHRVVTLMQQQAESFDISLDEIGLADIHEEEFLR